jgi:prevent-host-death family protein
MEISSDQAQENFSDLLERVSKGEQFAITKDGAQVAMLVSLLRTPKTDVRAAIAELMSFAQGQAASGMPIRAMIEEGRRE